MSKNLILTTALTVTLTACTTTEDLAQTMTVVSGSAGNSSTCLVLVDTTKYNSKLKLSEDLLYMLNNAACEHEGIQNVRVCSIEFPCPSLPTVKQQESKY
ncbi:hypothetical protein CYG27_RS03330 [Vibrio parahaemolyticus]|nr:hypothetical protein [Vibrio parahaemolyticus]EGQ9559609.1 hypothetical protein [Vibrio parahaemolyticus]EGQ9605607.1 hypothetical protein [Vibrio parahaemolyticus]EGQ9649795.1 hypothetical protein [Vibrio parahaemolyticus]EGQ9674818.1 hypothetical protein [Vibrio parahaemolyticus]